MGFQKIWQPWSWTTRPWERAGFAAGLKTGAAGLGGLDPASDAAIMLRVAAGDEAGFQLPGAKYHRPMIHFLFRMVRNQAVAEELAQEVFLRVYRSRESYRAEAKFTTWLYRIATNLAVNHARDTGTSGRRRRFIWTRRTRRRARRRMWPTMSRRWSRS
jgi:DNA-directed RNA polymerase specialized sigma24 family protein